MGNVIFRILIIFVVRGILKRKMWTGSIPAHIFRSVETYFYLQIFT